MGMYSQVTDVEALRDALPALAIEGCSGGYEDKILALDAGLDEPARPGFDKRPWVSIQSPPFGFVLIPESLIRQEAARIRADSSAGKGGE